MGDEFRWILPADGHDQRIWGGRAWFSGLMGRAERNALESKRMANQHERLPAVFTICLNKDKTVNGQSFNPGKLAYLVVQYVTYPLKRWHSCLSHILVESVSTRRMWDETRLIPWRWAWRPQTWSESHLRHHRDVRVLFKRKNHGRY